MNPKIIGSLCGIISAVTYGLNPLAALHLYSDGVNVDSVIFYRYGLAALILALGMLLQKQSFKIARRELAICAFLGFVFAVSSITFFSSLHYMDAGITCTILFIYPVIVAVIMAVFFKERLTLFVAVAILMTLAGVSLLYKSGNGEPLNTTGVFLITLSALNYAVYIVGVHKSRLSLPPLLLTFYVMLVGTLVVALHSCLSAEYHLQALTSLTQWGWVLMLAVVPTVISLLAMVVAVKNIGSTPTAIMGALEPVTAVIIGVTVFGESFTLRIAAGMALIMLSVSLIILERPLLHRLKRQREKI